MARNEQKIYTKTAKILTFIFSPVFMGSLFLFYSLWILSPSTEMFSKAFVAILFFSILLPVIFTIYLIKKEKIKNFHLKIRKERTLPFAFAMLTSTISLIIIKYLGVNPEFLRLVLTVYLMALGYVIINLLKFKISAHVFVFFSSVLVLTFFIDLRFVYLAPLVLPIGWARVQLDEHTVGEVAGGVAYSIFSFIIFSFLFQ